MFSLIGAAVNDVSRRLLVDIAMYFGVFVIVAMALNFQYGNAGIPNMGCAVQVITGGLAVSTFTLRLTLWFVKKAGENILPYASNYDWVYNNPANIIVVNEFIKNNPIFGVSLLLFSLVISLVMGAIIGWLISLPAIRLRSTLLMITLISFADASQIIARNWPMLCGGTMGVYVPNVFAWYPGDRGIITALVTLVIGLISYLVFRTMLCSPYGRLMRAVRENEITLNSVGKNAQNIRMKVMVFSSAITALSGAIWAFYFSYVIDTNYQRSLWTYWPWLMLIVGGPGNNAGTYLGCALIILMRRIVIVYKWYFEALFFFPISYFEQILLGTLLMIFILFRPSGIIAEKLLYIPGINYRKLIREEVKADWRMIPKARTGGGRLKLWEKNKERSG